jgi:hypothetical protein
VFHAKLVPLSAKPGVKESNVTTAVITVSRQPADRAPAHPARRFSQAVGRNPHLYTDAV